MWFFFPAILTERWSNSSERNQNFDQLTCLPSWPTLVWPLTTVLMLSSRRLSNVTKKKWHLVTLRVKYKQKRKKVVIKSLIQTHRIFRRILFTTSSILAKDCEEIRKQDIRKTWGNLLSDILLKVEKFCGVTCSCLGDQQATDCIYRGVWMDYPITHTHTLF